MSNPFDDIFKSLKQGWNFRLPSISIHGGSGVRKGFRNPFLTEKEREQRETIKLYEEVKRAFDATPYADNDKANDFIFNIVVEACDRAGVTPTIDLGEALYSTVRGLLAAEGSIYGFVDINPRAELTLEEGVSLREFLNRKRRFLSDHDRLLDIWREKVIRTLEGIIGYLPASLFGEDVGDVLPASTISALLIDLCESPAEVIERAIMTMFDDDITNARLFDGMRQRLDTLALLASGISPERKHDTSRSIVLPTVARKKSNAELVVAYLAGTPYADLFLTRFPFAIPFPVRFEHTHVVGGSGHGKTQLLQLFIHQDILAADEDNRSIVVIDSQGDLIRTISHLGCFDQDAPDGMANRLLLIDPNDVEYPVCLNMFDWNRERLSTYAPVDREKILNATVELYEYLFGALLGAELTQRQGLIFKYLARLMMEIPGATIHTLRQLMENGEQFRPFIEKLPPTARSFFETRFFDRSFNETKKQILTRLWGVLSNAVFDRMFSHPKNKVDIFEATKSGKIILINTAKELLKQEGSAIFGRFFVALLAQATIQRATLEPHERTPTFVYIDEAQDYFDQNIEHLLTQARKYRLGMVLAHQNLDQLGAGLRASIMSNTSTKFAGGVSAKDATAFASEMRCDSEFVHGMRKGRSETNFACFVRNLTPQAIGITVPLGSVEPFSNLSEDAFQAIIAKNRARYCALATEIDALQRQSVPKPRSPEAPTKAPLHAPTKPQPPENAAKHVAPPPKASPEAEQAEHPPGPLPFPHQSEDTPVPRRRLDPPPREPQPMGRGGARHKDLQRLIKEAAEERGFRATIEETILDGAGRVDVSLSRAGRRIACEISIASARDQELGNVEKCLDAGFDEVILIASTKRQLATLCKFITPHLDEDAASRVRFHTPEDVIIRLDELVAATLVTEQTSRGYRVRVTREVVSAEQVKTRREAIAGVVARSIVQAKKEP